MKETSKKLVEKHWDYTSHAKFYEYRPNYAPNSIDMLLLAAKNATNPVLLGGGGKFVLEGRI